MTLRRTIPVWILIAGWTAVVYGLLWIATFVFAAREARGIQEDVVANGGGRITALRTFDPAVFPPVGAPDDVRSVCFCGNVVVPCPFIASHDFALYSTSGGYANRSTNLVVFGYRRRLAESPYWKWRR